LHLNSTEEKLLGGEGGEAKREVSGVERRVYSSLTPDMDVVIGGACGEVSVQS